MIKFILKVQMLEYNDIDQAIRKNIDNENTIIISEL